MLKWVSQCFIALILVCMSGISVQASSMIIMNSTLLGAKSVSPTLNKTVQKHIKYHDEEICLALGLYHEARGEPSIGQYAVGATILNRVRSSAYPDTVCDVVFQNQHMINRCQFSFACDGISDKPYDTNSFIKMKRLAKTLLKTGLAREAKFIGQVFQATADGMTHYHRHDVYPGWSNSLEKLSQLGAHVFFKSTRVTKRYTF